MAGIDSPTPTAGCMVMEGRCPIDGLACPVTRKAGIETLASASGAHILCTAPPALEPFSPKRGGRFWVPFEPGLQPESAKARYPSCFIWSQSGHAWLPRTEGVGAIRKARKEHTRVLSLKTITEHPAFLLLHLLIKCPVPSGVCFELLLIIFSWMEKR